MYLPFSFFCTSFFCCFWLDLSIEYAFATFSDTMHFLLLWLKDSQFLHTIVTNNTKKSLINFLKTHEKKLAFLHCDVDTYETTKYILINSKKYLVKGSIVIFDDLHNRAGWKEGQIKALNEVFQENEYFFIAFSDSGQAAIEIK